MQKLCDMYKGAFFSKRHKLAWRVPIVCDAIETVFKPESVVDVGCATADFVKGFQDRGIDSNGIEGSPNCLRFLEAPEESVYIADLRIPFSPFIPRLYEVATCFEVAEHIEEEYVEEFLDNLVLLSQTIVMSFAPPGAGGHYHVNCQHAPYWLSKMAERGFKNCPELVEAIREQWKPWAGKREMRSYYNHLLCFKG